MQLEFAEPDFEARPNRSATMHNKKVVQSMSLPQNWFEKPAAEVLDADGFVK